VSNRKKLSWLDRLLFGPTADPPQRKLSKKERRRIRLLEREAVHRTEFLDYLNWLLKQPFKVHG
jgi:hypothetical protein